MATIESVKILGNGIKTMGKASPKINVNAVFDKSKLQTALLDNINKIDFNIDKNGLAILNNTVKPQKNIFDNMQELLEYAKKRCIDWVDGEYLVVIDPKKKRVISEQKGSATNVAETGFNIFKRNKTKCITIHKHPTIPDVNGKYVTTPISMQDFRCLNDINTALKDTAVNAKGEFSSLSKTKKFRHLTEEQMKDLDAKYADKIFCSADKSTLEEIKLLAQRIQKNPFDREAMQQFDEIWGQLQLSESGINAIHEFWIENAKKLGLKYKTNYACFK